MQVNATMMLSIWLSGLPQPALSALYSTSRLTVISRPMPSSSGRSRCAMKRSHNWRLVMFSPFLAGLIRQGLRYLAEQVVVHHLARDRRGRAAAMPAVLGQHHQRDSGLFGGREGDEPGMVAVPLVDFALVVFFALLHGDHLRGAGLAGDAVARDRRRARRRAARLVDRDHRAPHQVEVRGRNLHVEFRLVFDQAALVAARAAHFPDHMRPVAYA